MVTMSEQAAERGRQAGLGQASWAFDGNTSDATYRAFLQGYEDGDPEVMDRYGVSPLSGEWAGESINELLGDLLDEAEDEDDRDAILEAYEVAFQDAYWDELVRVASLQVCETA